MPQWKNRVGREKSHGLNKSSRALRVAACDALEGRILFSTIVVNTTADQQDVAANATSVGSTVSLRDAVIVASNLAGATEIDLPAGTYNLGNVGTGELRVGAIAGQNISIKGLGTTANTAINQTVSGNRIFNYDNNQVGTIVGSISNITMENAQNVNRAFGGGAIVAGGPGDALTLTNCVLQNDSTSNASLAIGRNGGGISYSGGGDLTIQNCQFLSDTAGGNPNSGSVGGAISYNNSSAGNLTISNTVFSNDTATGVPGTLGGQAIGGALQIAGMGTASITATTFTNDSAGATSSAGGAIYASSMTINIADSRFFNDTAASGSGIDNAGATITANNNWWGADAFPGAPGTDTIATTAGSTTVSTRLALAIAPASPAIMVNSSTNVTASIVSTSAPTVAVTGTALEGVALNFAPGSLGSVNPSSAAIAMGSAVTTFSSGSSSGTTQPSVTLDNGTKSTSIMITAPAVTGVSSTTANGTYGIGTLIPITVSFNAPVTVTGTPTLALNSGGTASYTAGSGTSTLTFDYTVAAGDKASPLDYASNSALSLSGGTITNNGVNATLTLPTPGSAGSLGSSKNIKIVTTLIVTSVTPSPSGFTAQFNEPFNPHLITLYDAANNYGPPDVTLVGASTGPVSGGSLLLDPTDTKITFITSGGLLPPDTYTLTLRSSASNAFADTNGMALDGNADGTPGDNYNTTFTIAPSAARTISIPDFARGPGQSVTVPAATGTGLPIYISDGTGVTSVRLTVNYDPSLLTITGAQLGPADPAGSSVSINTSIPGDATFTFTSPTALPAGLDQIVDLTASVPASAPYRSVAALPLSNVLINGGAIRAIADGGVEVVDFLGDANGDGTYSSVDSTALSSVASGADTGFVAFPLVAPAIIGDINVNGRVDSGDATLLNSYLQGGSVPQIPPYTSAPTTFATGPNYSPMSMLAVPTISTMPQPASVIVGATIADQATVSGGHSPSGTVTFNLYDNSAGTGTPLYTDTVMLASGGATSGNYITTASGTYYWIDTYNGDMNNASVPATAEPVTVADQPVLIGDFVWNDLNANGIQDSGEPGISGVALTLTGTNGAGVAITDHSTTDSSGSYNFNEAPGTYTVTVDASNLVGNGALFGFAASPTLQGSNRATDSNPNPSGTTPGTLASGSSDPTVDFGYYKASVDVGVTISDSDGGSSTPANVGTASLGTAITYTIMVSNTGAGNATGASLMDKFPTALTSDTYTATATGGASGFTPSGTGDISDSSLSLPSGSTIVYTVTANISPSASGTLSDTAKVSSANDLDSANDSATDSDLLISQAATVMLSNLTQTYDGTGKAVTVTTTPPGLTTSVTYTQNNIPVASPTNAGTYSVTATVTSPGYAGSTSGTLTISQASASLTASAGPTVVVGTATPLTASAVLTGVNPTGKITFTLYSPSNTVVYTDVVPVTGNGTYSTASGTTTGSAVPTVAGTYQWVASYSGDGNNKAVATTKGATPEVAVGAGETVVGGVLYLIGGNTSDILLVTPIGSSKTGSTGILVAGALNGSFVFNLPVTQSFSSIYFNGFNGNDSIGFAPSLTIPTTLVEGNGNDNVSLGGGADTATLGNGNDNLLAGDGNNTITAGNGSDYVSLGNGNNSVTLGSGRNDSVHVGNGNNVVVVLSAANTTGDSVLAGNGNDLIVGGLGQEYIQAGNGSDILIDGSVKLSTSALVQILNAWVQSGATTANVASIRSQLKPTITYNTTNHNQLRAGTGKDWFWYTYAKDVTNKKTSDLLN